MEDFEPRKNKLDNETANKIRKLGDPFSLNLPGPAEGGADSSDRALTFLAPSVAAPFFAAVLIERDLPVSFPEESKLSDDKLGLAGNRKNKPLQPPRPLVPLVPYFEEFCDTLVERNQPGPHRLNWVRKTFQAPKEHEERFFTPPRVPAEAWSHMQLDTGTWTNPEKSAPQGVEGGSGTAAAAKRRRVPPWNQHRDAELSGLETLARDGMRLANASLLTFSHLMNGLLDEKSTMDPANRLRSLYTLKDLQYCTGEHFCRLASQLAHLRKLNAMAALNLADDKPFRDAKLGPDLFGGKFKALHDSDVAIKKERIEQDKLRKAQQKASAPPPQDKGNQSFRRKADRKDSSKSQPTQSSRPKPKSDDNRRDSGRDRRGGGKKHGGGHRGGRGGKRGGGGGGSKGRANRRQ